MRDYKFAINDLRGLAMFEHREEFIHTMDVESINLAIEALEKQIPKKPTYSNGDYFGHWPGYQCPGCGTVYSEAIYPDDYYDYCPYCGQALDWTEIKEAEDC